MKNKGVMAKNRFQTKKSPINNPVILNLIIKSIKHKKHRIKTLTVGLLRLKLIIIFLKSTLYFKVNTYFFTFKVLFQRIFLKAKAFSFQETILPKIH